MEVAEKSCLAGGWGRERLSIHRPHSTQGWGVMKNKVWGMARGEGKKTPAIKVGCADVSPRRLEKHFLKR